MTTRTPLWVFVAILFVQIEAGGSDLADRDVQQRLLAQADSHRQTKNWAEAALALNSAWPKSSELPSEAVAKAITEFAESLGRNYLKSDGTPGGALTLLERAATQNHRGAASLLAAWSAAQDEPRLMLKWNHIAARLGDARAMTRIGQALIESGAPTDEQAATRWFRQAAEAGDAGATYALGECYLLGVGVDRNPEKAVQQLLSAHEGGDAKATLLLGTCYRKGLGVERDFAAAAGYFQTALERGAERAAGHLGLMNLKGQGVPFDAARGAQLLQQGAEVGDVEAAYHLGRCFEDGVGVDEDSKQARRWIVDAAHGGHPMALTWCKDRAINISAGS